MVPLKALVVLGSAKRRAFLSTRPDGFNWKWKRNSLTTRQTITRWRCRWRRRPCESFHARRETPRAPPTAGCADAVRAKAIPTVPAPAGTTRRDTRSITPPQFRAATQFSTRRADFQQRAIVREAEIQSTSNGIAAVREAIYAGGDVYASSPAGSKESTPRKSINVTFSPNAAAAQNSVSTDRLPIALRSAPGAGKRASPSNQAGPSSDRTSPSKSVAFSMYGSNDGRMPGSSNNGTPGTPQDAARRHPRGQMSHQALQQQVRFRNRQKRDSS